MWVSQRLSMYMLALISSVPAFLQNLGWPMRSLDQTVHTNWQCRTSKILEPKAGVRQCAVLSCCKTVQEGSLSWKMNKRGGSTGSLDCLALASSPFQFSCSNSTHQSTVSACPCLGCQNPGGLTYSCLLPWLAPQPSQVLQGHSGSRIICPSEVVLTCSSLLPPSSCCLNCSRSLPLLAPACTLLLLTPPLPTGGPKEAQGSGIRPARAAARHGPRPARCA